MSTELDIALACSRTSASNVQGCQFGCLDDGTFFINSGLPPASVKGVEVVVVIGADQLVDTVEMPGLLGQVEVVALT
jgi:hypothetical protein